MDITHTENQKECTKIYRDDKISSENIITVRCMRFHAYGWHKILSIPVKKVKHFVDVAFFLQNLVALLQFCFFS